MRACSQRIKKIAVFYLTFLFVFGLSSIVLAGSPENTGDRDAIVDHELGGMKEGSRILSPEGYTEKTAIPQAPGSKLAPTIDTQAFSSSRGSEKAAIVGSGAEGISSGAGSISSPVGAGAGVGGGTGGISTGGGSVGTGSEGGSEVGGPSSGSGATLIDVDTNVNLDSGTVDAGVGIDTNAGIQESTILDADLSATGGGTAADISSSTDISSGQDVTSDSSLVAGSSETALSPESDLGTEVDTSGSSVGGETDVGIEADVSGIGAGDDVASDPADGIPSGL